MKGDIKLHREHGLNPTITICYFCGEEKNEIALLGAGYKGKAPKSMCIDMEPCDRCKNYMKQGIMFISVKDGARRDDPYRTGKIVVLKESAVRDMVANSDHPMFSNRFAFVEDSVWSQIGLPESEG